jgi:uncharacterized protein (TIGR02246 family)
MITWSPRACQVRGFSFRQRDFFGLHSSPGRIGAGENSVTGSAHISLTNLVEIKLSFSRPLICLRRIPMRKTIVLMTVAMVTGAAWQLIAADQTAGKTADEKALRAACDSYVKAVNSGDVAAIVAHWTDDADYVNDSGEKFKGRAALTKLFKNNLPSVKGKKFSFETDSLRMIAPGVALEDGVGKLVGDDEDENNPGTRYSAVWVRSGDKWLISSVRDLGDLPANEKNASPLKELDWLVGSWQSTDSEADVDMTCASALDGKFLKQKYDVTNKQGQKFTVVTLVGWDPAAGQIRSWFFDSRGGFGDGVWTREGNTWKIAANGIVSDGRTGNSTNVWKYIDDKTAVWTAKDRELDGVPMPDTEVKFVRKATTDASK